MQEMAKGFSLFEEALLVFEAQGMNVERYRKVAAAVQNAMQCYHVTYDEKKRPTTQTSLDRFFKRVIELNLARNQNLCHQRQAWVKLQLALRLLSLMILQLYHPPPPFPPPVSNSSCLFTRCQPLYANCCTVLLYFSRYCTVRLKMFYFLCLFFRYYLCEKYYKPITVQYYVSDCVSWVPRLSLLDLTNKLYLRMRSRNGTPLYVGDLLYI